MGLGTWQLRTDTAGTVQHALEIGYRMIDTSGDYGTQTGIGEGLRRSGIDRADVYIVTKVEETDDAYEATKANLAELGIAYADLMLIHRPPLEGVGRELWKGLIRAKQEGLMNDIGVSNYSADQIDRLIDIGGDVPAVNQIEWSPFGYDDSVLTHAAQRRIAIQAYSPLTRGERLADPTLIAVAKRYGKSPAQTLIRWSMEKGAIPIPKANTREHLEENIRVFDFALSAQDMETLDSLNEHYSSLGGLPYVRV